MLGCLILGWRRVTAGFPEGSTPLPCRLSPPPPVSCPVPPSFYSTSHRATVRPPARPYGFYHLSIELSRVKAFNTWVFGTHSKSLSRHLDSFSILKSWPFFFFFGFSYRRRQKTGSSFWLFFHLWPWMLPSFMVPPLFANHRG